MKIFHNAVVYTGDNFTSAFAVEDGRFVAMGDAALALEGDRIDLGGAFVCAGFNDSHTHLLSYGQALSMAPLAAHTGSLAQMLECLKNTRPDRGDPGPGLESGLFFRCLQDADSMGFGSGIGRIPRLRHPCLRSCFGGQFQGSGASGDHR